MLVGVLDVGAVTPDAHIDTLTRIADRERGQPAGVDLAEIVDHLVQTRPGLVVRPEEEVAQHLKSLRVTLGDLVELVLQCGGEPVVDQLREVLHQQPGHRERQPGGHQRGALLVGVVACGDGADDGRVGGRPADLQFFELGDQRRLGVAGRRLGLVSLRPHVGQVEALVGGELGQLGLLGVGVLGRIDVGLQIAGEGDGSARCREGGLADRGGGHLDPEAEPLRQLGADPDADRLPLGVGHLGRDGPLPDQLVQLGLVTVQFRLGGGAERVTGGADRLVRLLGVLHLGRVAARRGRHIVGAVERTCLTAGSLDRLLGQRDRVGTHIGDVARLVELLGDPHRTVGGEAELASGLLLQRGGAERSRGAAAVRLGLHRIDGEDSRRQCGGQRLRGPLIEHQHVAGQLTERVEVGTLGDAPIVQSGQLGVEEPGVRVGAGVQGGRQVPVGRRPECDAFAFPVDDQPSGDRLDAAGRKLRHDLLPQHRRDLVAVEPVEDAAGLLGVHQVEIKLAGVRHRIGDGLRGDLVKDHPLHRDLGFEFLQQMPSYGLALAVLIGCQEEFVGVGQCLLELADGRLLIGADHVQRSEVVLDVDTGAGPRFALVLGRYFGRTGGQVAHMSAAGLDHVTVAEEAGEHGRLGRRLDDHQSAGGCGHVTVLLCGSASGRTWGMVAPITATGAGGRSLSPSPTACQSDVWSPRR